MHGKLLGVVRAAGVSIRYPVMPSPEAWVLPEGIVPESIPHDDAAEHLKLTLLAWAERSERELAVARNLAIPDDRAGARRWPTGERSEAVTLTRSFAPR